MQCKICPPSFSGTPPGVNITHLSSLLSRCCVTPQGFALATDKLLTAIETQGATSSASTSSASTSSSSSSSSSSSLGLILLECLDCLTEKGIDSNSANQRVLKDKVCWMGFGYTVNSICSFFFVCVLHCFRFVSMFISFSFCPRCLYLSSCCLSVYLSFCVFLLSLSLPSTVAPVSVLFLFT